jgi:hypothetical protein
MLMASKKRPAVTTPNRAIAESIGGMILEIGPCTDRVEAEVWSQLTELDHEDIWEIRDRTLADLVRLSDDGTDIEVEMLITQRLEEQGDKQASDELLATRTRTIAAIIARRVTRMAPSEAKRLKAMVAAVLEERERELIGLDPRDTKQLKMKVTYSME